MVRMIKNYKELFSLRGASNTVTLPCRSRHSKGLMIIMFYDLLSYWMNMKSTSIVANDRGRDQNNIQLDAQKTSLNVL